MSLPKRSRRPMTTSVGDVCRAVDAIAPFSLAAEWDNVGMLAGRPEWPARHGLLAIDLTDAVAREALAKRADLLLIYHPPIFKGIKRITPDGAVPTTLLPDLLAARVAIIALHTALDAAVGGTNDVLLDAIGVDERCPLEPATIANRDYKLVVFVPRPEVGALREALSAAGAGVIGHYTECSFELDGHGTFKGDETTNPTVGRRQVLERCGETRLEMVVPRARLAGVVRALHAAHSYEEPALDIYPVEHIAGRGAAGMGRVGKLARPESGRTLVKKLARSVDMAGASVVGDLKRKFTSVTAAAGAFGVEAFRDSHSLVITGEFKHHDALALLKRGVTAVHVGHDASERPALKVMRRRLARRLSGLKLTLARADRSPLTPLGIR